MINVQNYCTYGKFSNELKNSLNALKKKMFTST